MSFSENLRQARKDCGYSQDQLAELLNVSRQSVSKWESDVSLPETEKLAALADALDVTIDFLMTGRAAPAAKREEACEKRSDRIIIKSYDSTAVVSCLKVKSSPIFYPSKNEPRFILNGVDRTGIFGDHDVILGFYSDEESIKREIDEITQAMADGEHSYTLKYFADVVMKGLSPKLRKPQ